MRVWKMYELLFYIVFLLLTIYNIYRILKGWGKRTIYDKMMLAFDVFLFLYCIKMIVEIYLWGSTW